MSKNYVSKFITNLIIYPYFLIILLRSKAFMTVRTNSKKILVGASYLLSEKLLKLLVGLIVHALMARYLSPVRFGKMGYIINLATALLPLTLLGLDDIGVKRMVGNKNLIPQITSEILTIRFFSFIGVTVLSGLFLFFFVPNESLEFVIMAWVFCIFYNLIGSFYTFELPHLSDVENRPIFSSRLSGYVAGTLMKLAGIFQDLGFKFILATYLVEEIIGKYVLLKSLPKEIKLSFSRVRQDRMLEYIRPSFWIVIGSFFAIVENKIGFLVLEKFAGPKALGFYTAAFMLVDLWTFVPLAIISAVLPSILEIHLKNSQSYEDKVCDLHGLFFLIQIGFVGGVWIIAPYLINVLYGADYSGAEHYLRWQSFTVFVTFTQLLRLRIFLIQDKLKIWTFMVATQLVITVSLIYVLGIGGKLEYIVLSSFLSFILVTIIYSIFDSSVLRIFQMFLLGPFYMYRGVQDLAKVFSRSK